MTYRHGDLLIVHEADVAYIPGSREGATVRKDRVLATGEATGHAHVVDDAVLFEKDGRLYFDVTKARTTLRQTSPVKDDPDIHGPITLPRGRYLVIQERQYTPGPIPVQNVVD